jgi:hypothetical protein
MPTSAARTITKTNSVIHAGTPGRKSALTLQGAIDAGITRRATRLSSERYDQHVVPNPQPVTISGRPPAWQRVSSTSRRAPASPTTCFGNARTALRNSYYGKYQPIRLRGENDSPYTSLDQPGRRTFSFAVVQGAKPHGLRLWNDETFPVRRNPRYGTTTVRRLRIAA